MKPASTEIPTNGPPILTDRHSGIARIQRQKPRNFWGIWHNYQVAHHEYFPAYLLFCEPLKDLHRHAIFLNPDYGLLSAFLYGAVSKRNPLRATVQPYSFGSLNIKAGKGHSLHVADWQLEAPSLLLSPPSCAEVYRHAALWSELLLHSHGLGQYQGQYQGQYNGPQQRQRQSNTVFAELRSLLSAILHFDNPAHCRLASLRFFWQSLLLEGFHPGLERCHNCDLRFELLTQKIFFSDASELLCARCAHAHSGHFLSSDELNLLCWAEQNLSSFVRQDEFFFGHQTPYYAQIATTIFSRLQNTLEYLLGHSFRSV